MDLDVRPALSATNMPFTFLGPRGPLVLSSIGPSVPSRVQEFLLLLLLLLLLLFLLLLLLSCHPKIELVRGYGGQGSRFNLADLSRTICSCLIWIIIFHVRWLVSRRQPCSCDTSRFSNIFTDAIGFHVYGCHMIHIYGCYTIPYLRKSYDSIFTDVIRFHIYGCHTIPYL